MKCIYVYVQAFNHSRHFTKLVIIYPIHTQSHIWMTEATVQFDFFFQFELKNIIHIQQHGVHYLSQEYFDMWSENCEALFKADG